MAHVPLVSLGSARESFCDPKVYEAYRAGMDARDSELQERRAKVAEGWGADYIERVHPRVPLRAPAQ